jgi:hypothetical protein
MDLPEFSEDGLLCMMDETGTPMIMQPFPKKTANLELMEQLVMDMEVKSFLRAVEVESPPYGTISARRKPCTIAGVIIQDSPSVASIARR